MMLAKKCAEIDRKGREILADLISLIRDDHVVQDEAFLRKLTEALDQAKRSAGKGRNGNPERS